MIAGKLYWNGKIMNNSATHYKQTLRNIDEDGLYKKERTITTPQGVAIRTEEGGEVLNFCANNYLSLIHI